MTVTFVVVIWALFGVATVALAVFRWFLSGRTQDVVHLGPGEEREIPVQTNIAQKLNSIDRWGKALTLITALIGLALASAYLYQAWQNPAAAPNIFYKESGQ